MKYILSLFWVSALLLLNKFCLGDEVSDDCVACVCEAMTTNCNRDVGCTPEGVCGPLRLTKPFWQDGGMFHFKGTDPNDPKAFEDCAKNLYCASETLRSYARRYARDCDGNGKFDCYDYIKIHEMGPKACTGTVGLDTAFFVTAKACIARTANNTTIQGQIRTIQLTL